MKVQDFAYWVRKGKENELVILSSLLDSREDRRGVVF